jgi:hypothetical protein
MMKRIKLSQAKVGDVIIPVGDLTAFSHCVVVKADDGMVQLSRPYAQVVAAGSSHPYALVGLEKFSLGGSTEVYLIGHSPAMRRTLAS